MYTYIPVSLFDFFIQMLPTQVLDFINLKNVFQVQVSDFGLAKLSSDTNTHVSTRVMGTFG